MIAIFTWTLAGLSVIGVVLNIKKARACFFLWTFTNGAWMVYDYSIGAYAQAALFAVYFVLAIWGIIKWGRDARKENGETNEHS